MATGYVLEFSDCMTFENLTFPKWSSRAVQQSPVSFTSTHGESAGFAATTRFITFTADGIFSWTIGATPAATTSMMRFPAGTIFTIGVQASDKISFVTNT